MSAAVTAGILVGFAFLAGWLLGRRGEKARTDLQILARLDAIARRRLRSPIDWGE